MWLLLTLLSFASILASGIKFNASRIACSRELQNITFIPPTCQYFFMKQIADKFPVNDPGVWTIDSSNVLTFAFYTPVLTFMVNNNVTKITVLFQDGFTINYRIVLINDGYGLVSEEIRPFPYSSDYAQANVTGVGYRFADNYYQYTLAAFGPNARFMYIAIQVRIDKVQSICGRCR